MFHIFEGHHHPVCISLISVCYSMQEETTCLGNMEVLSLCLQTKKAFLKIYFLPPGVPSRGQGGQLVLPPTASSLPPGGGGGWGALQGSLERRGTLGKGRQIAAGKGALTKVGQISLYLILSVTVS